ncbi:hypothetical protein GOV13_01850 [Candidatus Pacearchaeota archaeon]|nr:hypothetical protein [Candidatus Pacearchaeota archaeon]
MRTILIDGTELSGKTTLVTSAANKLRKKGFEVNCNTGPLKKDSLLVKCFLTYAEKSKKPSQKDLGYLLAWAFDGFEDKQITQYFLQDRGFPSVLAYSGVFNLWGSNKSIGRLLGKAYSSFDYNIHVKTRMKSREERLAQRDSLTYLDTLIKTNPNKIYMLEQEISRIMTKERNYLEIDTSLMDVDESTEIIIGHIGGNL